MPVAPPAGAGATPGATTAPAPNVTPKTDFVYVPNDEILRGRVRRLVEKIVEHVTVIENLRKEDRERWQQFNKQIEELEALRAERMKIKKYKRGKGKEKEKKSDEMSGNKSKQKIKPKKKSHKSGRGGSRQDANEAKKHSSGKKCPSQMSRLGTTQQTETLDN